MSNQKDKMTNGEAIAFLLFLTLLFPCAIAFGGFVMMSIFNWVLSPLFGLPTLTFIQGIVVSMVLGIIKAKPEFKKTEKSEETKPTKYMSQVIGYYVAQAIVLLILLGFVQFI